MDRNPTSNDLIREAKQWIVPDETSRSEPAASPVAAPSELVTVAPPYPSDLIQRPEDVGAVPATGPSLQQPRTDGRVRFALALALVGIIVAGVFVYRQVTAPDSDFLFALGPGTCFIEADHATVGEVETVDCRSTHDLEVFANVTLPFGPGAALPDAEVLWSTAWQQCLPFFETYTGEAYDRSAWWLDAYVPDRHGWKAGDRDAVCVLYLGDADGSQLRADSSARA